MSAKKEQAQISAYTRKLRENVKAILENYGEILKAARVSHPNLYPCVYSTARDNFRYQTKSNPRHLRYKWHM